MIQIHSKIISSIAILLVTVANNFGQISDKYLFYTSKNMPVLSYFTYIPSQEYTIALKGNTYDAIYLLNNENIIVDSIVFDKPYNKFFQRGLITGKNKINLVFLNSSSVYHIENNKFVLDTGIIYSSKMRLPDHYMSLESTESGMRFGDFLHLFIISDSQILFTIQEKQFLKDVVLFDRQTNNRVKYSIDAIDTKRNRTKIGDFTFYKSDTHLYMNFEKSNNIVQIDLVSYAITKLRFSINNNANAHYSYLYDYVTKSEFLIMKLPRNKFSIYKYNSLNRQVLYVGTTDIRFNNIVKDKIIHSSGSDIYAIPIQSIGSNQKFNLLEEVPVK